MKQNLLIYGKTWKIILNKQLHIIKHRSPVACLFSLRKCQYTYGYMLNYGIELSVFGHLISF